MCDELQIKKIRDKKNNVLIIIVTTITINFCAREQCVVSVELHSSIWRGRTVIFRIFTFTGGGRPARRNLARARIERTYAILNANDWMRVVCVSERLFVYDMVYMVV